MLEKDRSGRGRSPQRSQVTGVLEEEGRSETGLVKRKFANHIGYSF